MLQIYAFLFIIPKKPVFMPIYESYKGIYTHRILTQRYTSILKERREYLEVLKKLTIFAVPKRIGSSLQ